MASAASASIAPPASGASAARSIAIRTLLLPLIPVPVPVILDEYSYLLGADTFASGRLTNPPHPMWVHFETFNVNMQPTYQSMYPPAQSLVLALGQKLTGEPWIGVLLSVAVMCALFCWMLQAWMPPQWALLGGLYAVARYGIFSYWINSYWGGAVAAIGGALLLGSLPRLRRRLSWQQSLVFALGLVILANSRPFEGFLFALPLLVAVAWLVLSLCPAAPPAAGADCDAGPAPAGLGRRRDALLQLARHRQSAADALHPQPGHLPHHPAVPVPEALPDSPLPQSADADLLHVS